MNIEEIQQILAKDVSRKEFFQHVAIFILAFIGISGLLSRFARSLNYQPVPVTQPTQSSGYGGQPYGR